MDNISPLEELRKHFPVKSEEMAQIASTQYQNYRKYERKLQAADSTSRTTVNIDMLVKWADFFAVSFDWLLGRTDNPYNDSILLSLETSCKFLQKNKLNLASLLTNRKAVTSSIAIPKKYMDPASRQKNYTQNTRARIITYINLLRFFNEKLSSNANDDDVLMEIDNIIPKLDCAFRNINS